MLHDIRLAQATTVDPQASAADDPTGGRSRSGGTMTGARIETPLSIPVIGLYMLFGACLMPINIYTHAPAFMMAVDFRGSSAAAFFVAMGTLDAAIGIGLLRLARCSRIAAICFFVFRIVNTCVTFLVPASRARFEEGVAAMRATLGQQPAPVSPAWFGPAAELCVMAVVLWFLIARQAAFTARKETAMSAP